MKSILLCATYKPPECPTTSFTDDFSDNYMKALSFGKDLLILGDLNYNLLKNCPERNALNDLCATLNLKQLVTSPTRVTEHSSSLIDVILASNIALVIDTKVMETHISDHFLIYSVLNLKSPKTPPNYIKSRTLKNYNAESFLLDLQAQQVAWTENFLITDVLSEKLEHFNQVFLDILHKHAPIKRIKLKLKANNNRPISLLPAAASKVCERIALNQFTQFMKSGDKAMHSTETMKVMMTDQVLQAMDDKKLTIVVLLDFSKAFDGIDHNKLLSKLKSLGTSSFALDWFRSYT